MRLIKQPWFIILVLLTSLYTYQFYQRPGSLQFGRPLAVAASSPVNAGQSQSPSRVPVDLTHEVSLSEVAKIQVKGPLFNRVEVMTVPGTKGLSLRITGEGVPPQGKGQFFKDWLVVEKKGQVLSLGNPEGRGTSLNWPSGKDLMGIFDQEVRQNSKLKLTIAVGKDLKAETWEIHLVHGDLKTSGLSAAQLNVRTVSGDVVLGGGPYQSLELKTVSGLLKVEAQVLNEIRATSVSGDVELDWMEQVLPPSHQISTVSGSVKAFVQADALLNVSFNSASGDLVRRAGVVDQSGAPIKVSTVSGDLLFETR